MLIQQPIQGLYAISDPELIPDDELLHTIEEVIRGGAKIIQYRNKLASAEVQFTQASQLSTLCKQYQVTLIINDDPHLAKAVAADGVHVGREDGKIADARKILGHEAIIGVSCYNQLENAHKASLEGANYVAFGRFFPSKTKPDALQADFHLLEQASRQLKIPIVAIGGINRENASLLIQHGADAIAVINDLFHDGKRVYPTAKAYQAFFK